MVDWKKKSESKRKPIEAVFNKVVAGDVSKDGKKTWSRINITITLPMFKDTEEEMSKLLDPLKDGDSVVVTLGGGSIQSIEKKEGNEPSSSSVKEVDDWGREL